MYIQADIVHRQLVPKTFHQIVRLDKNIAHQIVST
jgi:hypothetical protein